MTVLESIEAILAEEDGPLGYREITRRIIDSGLWVTRGKTPASTVSSEITRHIKERGDQARFVRTSPGTYALKNGSLSLTGACIEKSIDTSPMLPTKPISKPLSFLDAAASVLQLLGNSQPMHYRAITGKALELGMLQTQGQTPESTMYAAMLVDIDRSMKRGEPPRFVKHGKGMFGLATYATHGLADNIKRHNQAVRERLHARLYEMKANEFEKIIGVLLAKLGFEDVIVTRYASDNGIDVRGMLAVGGVIRTRMAVQAKKWKTNVQAPEVQKVRGSLGTHDQGLIITTSDFSNGARTEANRPNAVPVALMNGDQLVELLVEYGIGVLREELVLIEPGRG